MSEFQRIQEIELDNIAALKGRDFQFLNIKNLVLTKNQERRHICNTQELLVKSVDEAPSLKMPALAHDTHTERLEADEQAPAKERSQELNRIATEEKMKTTVAEFIEDTRVRFSLYEPSIENYKDLRTICVQCDTCLLTLNLFPRFGLLINSMRQHLRLYSHIRAVARQAGRVKKEGRPNKRLRSDPKQRKLNLYFKPCKTSEGKSSTGVGGCSENN